MNALTTKLFYKGRVSLLFLYLVEKKKKKVFFSRHHLFLQLKSHLWDAAFIRGFELWYFLCYEHIRPMIRAILLYYPCRADLISEKKLPCIQQPRSPTICVSRSSDEFVMQLFCCFSACLEVSYTLSEFGKVRLEIWQP